MKFVPQKGYVGRFRELLPVMKLSVFSMIEIQKEVAVEIPASLLSHPKKARMSQSQFNIILVCFFDEKRIVHQEFIQ